jgi:hypothetical protein
MKQVHLVVGVVTIVLTGIAGLFGAWCWWRAHSSSWFWRLLRASQVAIVIEAALGGVLILIGHKSPGLHTLYGVLPLLVSFFAEQLRISSAQMVLDQRGFESTQAVGQLPADEQEAVVVAILQRELGIMVLALLVNVVLLARAAMTGG